MTIARTVTAPHTPHPHFGTVVQINVSGGGVPKTGVEQASVTANGIVGDHQRNRKHHGGPDRALCLWSYELIEKLRAEGHALAPGCTGENLTVEGIDWSILEPGSVLVFGDSVTVEITGFARPCKTNAHWFVNGDFRRIDERRHPGWSRLYARVLTEGLISVNTPVKLRTPNV